ncbi:hypothetical protein [Pseudarthrobacter sp. fls2-241-R2A-168]|uniref:hypothetical protein n=1 Tax=Pseudarthrobacter sp. fls2-241-R2A-168 TaxID=3040304 RepID=UPI0025543F4D|nr:hypothetical protein [Pseudarthrobacter sp. fls2-241-R2A-168]
MTDMNNVPIMFFQVSATAIPTLLIAVAVGIKQGQTFAGFYERAVTGRHKRVLLVMTIVLPLIIILGELCALRAVLRGAGNELELLLVWGAYFNCLLLIFLEFIVPIGYKLKFKGFGKLMNGVSIGGGMLGLYMLLIAAGVIPL